MNWSNQMKPFSNRQFHTLHDQCVIMKLKVGIITLSVRKKWQGSAFLFDIFVLMYLSQYGAYPAFSESCKESRRTRIVKKNASKKLKSRSNSLLRLVNFLKIYTALQSKPSEMLPPWASTVSWMLLVPLWDVCQWPICLPLVSCTIEVC